ncbi:MAG: hypothetical protein ABFC77_00090 [Thermoguttaceae bacterium]
METSSPCSRSAIPERKDDEILKPQDQFITALQRCSAILTRGPKDFAAWQKKAREAVQELSDVLNNNQCGGVELGLEIPFQISQDLICFVNEMLRTTYLWNDVGSIKALPAPSAWLRTIQDFIETIGGPRRRKPAITLCDEDLLILQQLADNFPGAINSVELSALTGLRRQQISERTAWLRGKQLVKRPDGTCRKGHAITRLGMEHIGRSLE